VLTASRLIENGVSAHRISGGDDWVLASELLKRLLVWESHRDRRAIKTSASPQIARPSPGVPPFCAGLEKRGHARTSSSRVRCFKQYDAHVKPFRACFFSLH